MPPPEVLVIGDANPDLVLSGDVIPKFGQAEKLVDSADLVLGGSAAIVACGMARLGVPTALAAVVGDDMFGRFIRDELTRAGVDTAWLRTDLTVPTAVTVVLSAGDRAILTYPGTIAATGPDIVDDTLLRSVRHVHSASMFLTPKLSGHLPEVFRTARAAGATTSLDTNWDPAQRWTGVTELLAHTSVLLPNRAELLALTGAADLDAAAHQVRQSGCAIALKNGGDGGMLWPAAGSAIIESAPAVTVLDTTGAGDSFDAGYISALLDGLPDDKCLRRAVRCGSLSTRGFGGTAAQATRADVSD